MDMDEAFAKAFAIALVLCDGEEDTAAIVATVSVEMDRDVDDVFAEIQDFSF